MSYIHGLDSPRWLGCRLSKNGDQLLSNVVGQGPTFGWPQIRRKGQLTALSRAGAHIRIQQLAATEHFARRASKYVLIRGR
mmetsp:Transcript_73595/g.207862  ORF Transcript_73595/g.207862 Transcript_73595/m.207862 type:complete len:81 (-) Transcript_73595:1-243(-)